MHTPLLLCLLTATAVMSLTVQPVNAQTPNPVTVKIPFDFEAADQILPAGNYAMTVHPVSKIITLRHTATNLSIQVTSMPTGGGHEPPARSSLVFVRGTARHHLAEIWRAGETTGNQLSIPRMVEEARARNNTVQVAWVRPSR